LAFFGWVRKFSDLLTLHTFIKKKIYNFGKQHVNKAIKISLQTPTPCALAKTSLKQKNKTQSMDAKLCCAIFKL
jgi:predicted acetyltransferase